MERHVGGFRKGLLVRFLRSSNVVNSPFNDRLNTATTTMTRNPPMNNSFRRKRKGDRPAEITRSARAMAVAPRSMVGVDPRLVFGVAIGFVALLIAYWP